MHFIYPNEKNPDYTRGNVRKDKKKAWTAEKIYENFKNSNCKNLSR